MTYHHLPVAVTRIAHPFAAESRQRVGIVSWVAHCTQETSLLASPSGKSTTKMRQQFDSAATWKIQWVAGRGCSCADCYIMHLWHMIYNHRYIYIYRERERER